MRYVCRFYTRHFLEEKGPKCVLYRTLLDAPCKGDLSECEHMDDGRVINEALNAVDVLSDFTEDLVEDPDGLRIHVEKLMKVYNIANQKQRDLWAGGLVG